MMENLKLPLISIVILIFLSSCGGGSNSAGGGTSGEACLVTEETYQRCNANKVESCSSQVWTLSSDCSIANQFCQESISIPNTAACVAVCPPVGSEPNETGFGAVDLGSFTDTAPILLTLTGNIPTAVDRDWYRFMAVDVVEGGGATDSYDVRIEFNFNPNAQYTFKVYALGFQPVNLVCDVGVAINGSCNGDPPFSYHSPDAGVVPDPVDDTTEFYVEVYRVSGYPVTCDLYRLEVSNGYY